MEFISDFEKNRNDFASKIKISKYLEKTRKITESIKKGKKDIYNTTGNNFLSIKKIAKIIGKTINNTPVKLKKINKDDPDIVRVSSKRFINEFGDYNQTKFSFGIKKLINYNMNL